MSINLNGNEIEVINFNGNELDKVYFNNNLVYEKFVPIFLLKIESFRDPTETSRGIGKLYLCYNKDATHNYNQYREIGSDSWSTLKEKNMLGYISTTYDKSYLKTVSIEARYVDDVTGEVSLVDTYNDLTINC